MGNFLRVCIAVILILSIFTVSVFATPTGTYDMYSFDGRNVVGSSGSGNQYIANFTRSLAYIHSIIANISTTIDYYLPTMNNNIHYIHVALVDAFSPGAGDTRNMWTLMSQAVSGITAIQSAALGIAQDVYNINTTTTDIDRLVGLIHSDVDQVESQLTTINTNLNILTSKYNWNSATCNFIGLSNINGNYSLNNVNSELVYTRITSNISFSDPVVLYLRYPIGTSFPKYIEDIFAFNNDRADVKILYYDCSAKFFDVYLYMNAGFASIQTFTLAISNSENISFVYSQDTDSFVKYLSVNDYGFYDFLDHLYLMKSNDNTDLSDIKNILIDIDNNSDFIQNNNDLEINVDIDAADGQGVTAIISKLQDLFDFGVGLQEFLVTLNEFDNLHWFTSPDTYNQVNQDPRFSPGYIDLYD